MSSEFKYEVVDGDITACDCCGHEAPLSEFDKGPPKNGKEKLCNICAGSIISRLSEGNSQQDYERFQTVKIIAQVANIMLDEITGRRP